MSYEKHTWETGETITAEKMNNLEDGVASFSSGIMIINAIAAKNGSSYIVTADKTYEDVMAAYNEGKMIIVRGKVDFEGIGEDYQDYWPTRDYIMQAAPRPNEQVFTFSALSQETSGMVNYRFTVNTSAWQFFGIGF